MYRRAARIRRRPAAWRPGKTCRRPAIPDLRHAVTKGVIDEPAFCATFGGGRTVSDPTVEDLLAGTACPRAMRAFRFPLAISLATMIRA